MRLQRENFFLAPSGHEYAQGRTSMPARGPRGELSGRPGYHSLFASRLGYLPVPRDRTVEQVARLNGCIFFTARTSFRVVDRREHCERERRPIWVASRFLAEVVSALC